MEEMNVQFADSAKTQILAYFNSPQDEAVYPNQGVVLSNDPLWAAFYEAQPTIGQECLPKPT